MTVNKPWFIQGIVLLTVVGVAVVIGFWLGHRSIQSNEGPVNTFLSALDSRTQILPQAPILSAFSLMDQRRQPFTLEAFSRKWSLLFFGYTYCPDVCPNALMVLNKVYTDLVERNEADSVQVVFVSVDSPRDTTQQLANYLPYFNKNFIGVTGEPSQVELLAHQLGVAYRRVAQEGNNYLIDHSSAILLVDPLGRWRASFSPPHLPEKIASDFRKIRAYYAEECCLPPGPVKATIIKGREE